MVSRSSITLPANGFVAELSPLLRLVFPEAIAAYAFGSRVLGTARPDSDLDVAVLLPGYADPLQLWEAASQLAQLAGCAVDLLDLRAATTVMQHQVLTQGLTLFASQPTAGLFECFVMAEKLSLDEARMNLLNDIAATGSVYGR